MWNYPTWAFMEINSCPDCGMESEIWTTSFQAEHADLTSPRCITCILTDLSYMSNNSSYRNCQVEIEWLYANNPRLREDIYGEREPMCFGCWQVIKEGEATIEALDRNGVAHPTHDRHACTSRCDGDCAQVFVGNAYAYRRQRNSMPFAHVNMLINLGGDDMCQDCLAKYYEVPGIGYLTACESCNRFGLDNGNGDFHEFASCTYCENCYSNNVYECEDCYENYWADDGHDCDNGVIHEWDYKPRPVFFGHSEARYWFGFELEVENIESDERTHSVAERVQELMGEHVYLKRDGSLSDGFEIVSHPHTLESHQNDIKWSVLQDLRNSGFRSWNTESCGIHVHVSRSAFGNGVTGDRRRATLTAQAHELRFMKLIYDNQRQAERLAGRSSSRWASFADKGSLVNKVKYGSQNNDRYSAVNTDNSQTLEVRIFKGSLKKERVLSAIEFVAACVEYTRDLKVTSTNKALSWVKFVGYVGENQATYPNLFDKINESFSNDSVRN